ncbi:MAG: hypothetical protein KDA96_04450 [Planctomycetaceae bacterium]|nr:hypothetical protein [Planctomycetaceae bacterium]
MIESDHVVGGYTMRTTMDWVCAVFAIGLSAQTFAQDLPVPREGGFNELVILDPGVHEDGLPKVLINEDQQVEIPPTLHVHRYYYSGDKEFQGPLIKGGPTIVVARHPQTGEQKYIDVMLPAGAPEIVHTANCIEYVYTNRRVRICFSPLFKDDIRVMNLEGHGVVRSLRESGRSVVQTVSEKSHESELVARVRDVKDSSVNIAKGAVGIASRGTAFALGKTEQLITSLPLVSQLKQAGERADEAGAKEAVRQHGEELRKDADEFIPTIR